MVEKARRTEIEPTPRNDTGREWEVFVREDGDDPMRHVGSLAAPSAEVANEQASKLFGWYAQDLWLCPADEMRRYSTHSLDEDDRADGDTPTDSSEEPPVVDEDGASTHDTEDEPRVTEL